MTEWISPEDFDGTKLAATGNLSRVGTRANLFVYLREVWQRRSFASTFALFQMNAQTARSSLGIAWIVIVPTLQILIYGLIFGFVLGSNRPDNFLPYLLIGIAFFQMMGNAISDGANAIVGNQTLVNSLDFPRSLLPFAFLIANIMECLPIIAISLIALPFLGQKVSLEWLLLVPAIFLMILFSAGLTMISARLSVFWGDFKLLLPFFSRVFFYVSGVFWSIQKLGHGNPILTFVLWSNPLQLLISLARSVTVAGYPVSGIEWIAAGCWSVGTFVFGLVFFWLAEEKYGRNV